MKIFCIGFHKTGTSSLAAALRTLGYRVTGPNGVSDPNISKNVYELADRIVEQYDAFQDNPWPIIYRYLDERHPGSKFILSLREPDAWINSAVNHFGTRSTPMREWIYGVGFPKGNEDRYLSRFNRHNSDVLDYFSDRPDDLLVLDVTQGDGWKEICTFLQKDIIDIPFPHANPASKRRNSGSPVARIKRGLRRMIGRHR